MDFNALQEQFSSGQNVELNYSFIEEKDHQDIYCLLLMFFGYLDQLFLVEVVFTIMKEILINANKANAKRQYFIKIGKDINNPEDYKIGMKNFNENITSRWSEQREMLANSEFFVQVRFRFADDTFSIVVDNNVPLTPGEQERIKQRMEAARKINDLAEAFATMSDTEESAGLGLILTQLLLKNSGIGSEHLKIGTNGKLTRAILTIPKHIVPLELSTKLKEKILNEVEGLPPLPHTLSRLISLCNNPDSDFKIISDEIEKNPALSADLIKLSNSSMFANYNKVTTILQAVKTVGLKNIKNMLYVSGVRRILNDRYSRLQDVWDHSNQVSYYARVIGNDFKFGKDVDTITVGGLLHDIGKLVLLSVDKALYKKLISYTKEQDMSNTTILEEIAVGLSHPTLGAQLARKWDFPQELIDIIDFHHRPFMAGENSKKMAEVVYLANMIVDIREGKSSFFAVDQNILVKFNIENRAKFDQYGEKLETLYEAYKASA